ncbi:MAG: 4-(cytidine 5'-diphospho)-2-C-methyl-D-erythritol kinase [Alphaproteobacteria bacterium]
MAAPLRRLAPAKVNLYLHVLGRRTDGYHLLDSLVAFAGVFDRLEAAPAEDLSLTVTGPAAAALRRKGARANLVTSAARLLAEAGSVKKGARMRLFKRVPVGAGLGGGSADAAAALRLLSELWNLRLPEEDLRRLGSRLGADVPVCLEGRAAFVGGIGETVDPAPPLPPACLVLASSGMALPTERVYGAYAGVPARPVRFSATPGNAAALACLLAERCNDLERTARRLLPAVGSVLAALRDLEGCLLARMTGSGAACFGLFDDEPRARAAARSLKAAHPRWWVAAAPLLGTADPRPLS